MGDIDADEDDTNSIVTPRLVLRPPRPADGAAIAALTDPSGSRGADAETGDARAWLALARLTPGAAVFALLDRRSGAYAGGGGLVPGTELPRRAEIRLWIGDAFTGAGLATEAAHALIDHGFAARGIETLWCVSRVTNARAHRLIEKCGFQYRETGMARSVTLKGAVPVARFALERRVWASLKAWAGPPQRKDGSDAADRSAA